MSEGVTKDFTTNSEIRITKAKPAWFLLAMRVISQSHVISKFGIESSPYNLVPIQIVIICGRNKAQLWP